MEIRKVKNLSKLSVRIYSQKILEKWFNCKVISINYTGGGYFGYVYKAEIETEPYKVIMKACLADNMHLNEARDLSLLRKNCPIPVPNVYFTYDADENIPVDFICMEFMNGKDTLSAFNPIKLAFVSKNRKQLFADRITDAMHALHCTSNEKFGLTSNAVYSSWTDYYKPFAKDILNTSKKPAKV